MTRLLFLLALLACTETTAPTPSPQARLVDAAAALTQAAADVDAAGYRVVITLEHSDTRPPKVGVVILPK